MRRPAGSAKLRLRALTRPLPSLTLPVKIVSGQNPRQIALRILERAGKDEFVEELLETALEKARLSPPDRRLCQELVYGIVRWHTTLDWLINRKTDGRPQRPALQHILRLGL